MKTPLNYPSGLRDLSHETMKQIRGGIGAISPGAAYLLRKLAAEDQARLNRDPVKEGLVPSEQQPDEPTTRVTEADQLLH